MSNVSAAGTSWNCPNFVGELYLIGQTQTPFLSTIGSLTGGSISRVAGWSFPTAQPWSLEAASQPAITESASLTIGTPTTYVRSQALNYCQIYQYPISLSYALMSQRSLISGVALSGVAQPVQSELSFQINANLRQMAVDVEYTFLRGTKQAATNTTTAYKTGGMLEACVTNTVDASGDQLSAALINELMQEMADNGAIFSNMYIFASGTQLAKLSALFGNQPMSTTVGGVAIKQIYTDFCILNTRYCPAMPADDILIADVSVCKPVYLEVPGKGVVFYESLAKSGASENGQVYGQIGLDFGPESYHGTLTSLATTPST